MAIKFTQKSAESPAPKSAPKVTASEPEANLEKAAKKPARTSKKSNKVEAPTLKLED